jgi:membrane-bound ClpP family serine protease
MSNHAKLANVLSSFSLFAGILMVVIGVPALVIVDKNTSAFAILIAGIVAVLVGRLNLVEELSLGPLKARLRASIDEANATLRQLRAVAHPGHPPFAKHRTKS